MTNKRLLPALCAVLALSGAAGCMRLAPTYLFSSVLEKARLLYEDGAILDAREKAEAIGRKDPDYKAAKRLLTNINSIALKVSREHMEIAEHYYNSGIYETALSEYKTALRYNPKNQYVKNRVAFLSARLKSPAETGKNSTPASLAKRHYQSGRVYLDAEDWPNAIVEFSSALKSVPNYMDAKELLSTALEYKASAIDSHLKQGMDYFQTEDMDLAIEEWDAVLELDPKNKTAGDYRARAMTILDRLEKIKDRDVKQKSGPEQP
ncbi:MAG: hypothetical protein HY884_01790 [Deltaproteobacteria bacterium]|nr:hypothetical protein [Deltaproteobacteria bacterium]